MKLLSTWMDYLSTGRIRLDLGQGVVLDTDTLLAGVKTGGDFAAGASLASTHLDTVTTAGFRQQPISGSASVANGYPEGEYRGELLVYAHTGSTFVVQLYLGAFTGRLWQRELYGGKWSAWKNLTGTTTTTATAPAVTGTVVPERTRHTVGDYRPDAWSAPDGTVTYWTGPSGVERIPWTYRGGGYVGRLGAVTGYTTMQVRKVQSNNELEVSCLNPTTGRHVTYRVQGEGGIAYQDDQRRIEETWVGTYAGSTVSKDTLVMIRSNVEWAFQIDVAGNKQFAPYHGSTSAQATQYAPATITDGQGAALDLAGMAVDAVKTGVNGVKIRQRLYLTHPDAGATRFAAVDEVHTITPDGMLQSEAVVTFLQDTTVGSMYGPMTPVDQATFTSMKILGGATYTTAATAPASTTYIPVTEGHAATSALFTSGSAPGLFVAVNYLDPAASLMRGHALEETGTKALQLENRSTAGLNKLYPTVLQSGSVVPAGTVWRPSAQWRYGYADNAAQYQ